MNKKKIVILLNSLQPGGLLVSLSEAMKVVNTEKYDIYIYAITSYCFNREVFPENITVITDDDHSHYHRLPKSILLHLNILFLKLFRKDKNRIQQEKKLHGYVHNLKALYPAKHRFSDGVDVVISYAMGLCTEMAVNIKSKKKYLFFHSSDPDFHRDLSDEYFREFDNIIAVSNGVQNMLMENFPLYRNRIALLKNYIDENRIIQLADEYSVDFETGENRLKITSVIRVDKEKGADMLVDAAKIIKGAGVSFLWFVVGDGGCREKIQKQIAENDLADNVYITGFKDNPYPYIKCCDLYVHPAYEESFGLAILEALILKKAIVSTDTMGARDVLNNGKYGLLVSVDSKSIADGVLYLLNNQSLMRDYENSYQNINSKDKAVYKEKWESLLNGEIA